MVASEYADFAFHPALLLGLGRRAEFGGELPVGAEGHEARVLVAGVTAQDLLDRTAQVVVAHRRKHPAEIGKGMLMRLEESLLGGVPVRPVERRAALHAA